MKYLFLELCGIVIVLFFYFIVLLELFYVFVREEKVYIIHKYWFK